MKRVIQSVLSLSIIVLVSACGNNQPATENHEGHDHASHEGHDHGPVNQTSASAANINDDKLNTVYQHYAHLTKALTDGDIAEAKVAAAAIELGVKEVSGAKDVTASAAKIGDAKNLDEQRSAYSILSKQLIGLIKSAGLNSGSLYVGYCPMALNDEGAYWISSKKEVKNPYFGASMLTCGEIKETI